MVNKTKRGEKTKEIKRIQRHKILSIDCLKQALNIVLDDKARPLLERAIMEVEKI